MAQHKAINSSDTPDNRSSRGIALLSALFAACLIAALVPVSTAAQEFRQLHHESPPLILDAIGSFYVGGKTVQQTATEIGLYSAGPIILDQMYVQYLLPHNAKKPPLVLIHGGTLSGKSFETTPDGRMGWYEYFARQGYPTYLVDQVGRARSGFNQGPFNNVRSGVTSPASQPNIRRIATDRAIVRFRIGTEDGRPFADSQFPISAAAELAKQTVPDLFEALPSDNPNIPALVELADEVKGAVLISHSQAGQYPFDAVLLDPTHIRGVVAVEPGGCKASAYSDGQIAKLAHKPILILFGDHLDSPQKVGLVQWTDAFSDCQKFSARVKNAGGDVTLIHLPDIGIHGNSHMMMQDRNNVQVANVIVSWIAKHAS